MYHEVAPEYIVNLHSLEYPTLPSAMWRFGQVILMSIPLFLFGMWVCGKMGSMLGPTARNTPDQAHRMARLLLFMKQGNFSNAPDFLGRNNGAFYKTLHHEDMECDSMLIQILRKRGFIV